MEGLLNADVKKALEDIISLCFYNNRMFDRMVSILSVTFVMPQTGNIIHHNLAHLYPQLADVISDYMDDRNCTTIYGSTPVGDQVYDSPLDCLNYMLELNLKLETTTKDAIKVADSAGDYTTKVFLDGFLRSLIIVTSNLLLLVDKMYMYGNNKTGWMKFDHDIEDFGFKGDYVD